MELTRLQTLPYAAFLKALGGIVAIWAGSKIYIPFAPVPMTLQPMAIFLIGLTYTPRETLHTVGGYLALGAAGLPVFAGVSTGLAVFFGPTGGFLVGFLAASLLMSALCQFWRPTNFLRYMGVGLIGVGVLFGLGISWLALSIGFAKALTLGFYPFIAFDLIKVSLAAGLARSFHNSHT